MKRSSKSDEAVSITNHLAGLKKMFIGMGTVLSIMFAGMFACSEKILDWMIQTACENGYQVVYLSPQEILFQQFRIAGISALLLGLPLLMLLAYGFVRIALKKKERIAAVALGVAGYVLFLCGFSFACKLIYPFMLQFFQSVNRAYGVASAVSVESFADLAVTVFTVFGFVMELPVVCVVLALLGILDCRAMRVAEKPAVVIMFIVSAVMTPPDVVSQLAVAIPLVILYKVSEGIVWICWKYKKKDERDRNEKNLG